MADKVKFTADDFQDGRFYRLKDGNIYHHSHSATVHQLHLGLLDAKADMVVSMIGAQNNV